MNIGKLIFVIHNSSLKTPKKYIWIVLLIQKLINSLMKMKRFKREIKDFKSDL